LFKLLYKYGAEIRATLFDSSMGEVQQIGDWPVFICTLENGLPVILACYVADMRESSLCKECPYFISALPMTRRVFHLLGMFPIMLVFFSAEL
jgi:hypothetical protein